MSLESKQTNGSEHVDPFNGGDIEELLKLFSEDALVYGVPAGAEWSLFWRNFVVATNVWLFEF